MNKTPIGWVKNPDGSQGYTWNPITGCLNHVNGMCKGGNFPCYAYKLANGRLRSRYLANKNIAPLFDFGYTPTFHSRVDFGDYKIETDPFYPRFWEHRLMELAFWTKGKHFITGEKGIFVCDMSDLFGIGIPEEWTRRVLGIIRMSPRDRFYLLTKQPQNLPKWSPFPDNCWVGVTATDYKMATDARHYLNEIKASVKFMSLEPLLAPIIDKNGFPFRFERGMSDIDLVIIGAQTKPYKPPKIEWVEEIVRACDKAGVKVFLKDNLLGMNLPHNDMFFPYECPGSRHLRQEVPKREQ